MKLWTGLRTLFARRQLEAEMADEMRFHLESQIEANQRAGMSPAEARAAAQKQFGHLEGIQETCRDGRAFAWMDQLLRDIRFGLRIITKSPGHTAVVVLTLGFGIGVNTSIYEMASYLFFRPLPFADADRIVLLSQQNPVVNMPVGISYPDYQDFHRSLKTITGLSAAQLTPLHVSTDGRAAVRTWGQAVSPNAFGAFGVPVSLGRGLVPADRDARVVVLGHTFWKNRLAADPDIVGKAIRLNAASFTVVGVAAPEYHGFNWGMDLSAFIPAEALPAIAQNGRDTLENRWHSSWRILGRLAPGESLESAKAEVSAAAAEIARQFPAEHKDTFPLLFQEMQARPDASVSRMMPIIQALAAGMLGLVLLIACANVANLMSARMLSRRRELTLRSALGASRGRLILQLLTESLLLAGLAGLVGWYLARGAAPFLARLSPEMDIPLYTPSETSPDAYVFTLAVSLAAGLMTGLVPALRASRINLTESLNDAGGARVTGNKHRMRNLLVMSQITSSCVVLVIAAAFLRGLQAMKSMDLGFRPSGIVMTSFNLALQGYSEEKGRTFHREFLERVRALPGVQNASFTQQVPTDTTNLELRDAWPENPPTQLKDGKVNAGFNRVDPTYFSTMKVHLLQGRFFTDDDRATTRPVAVINAAFAEKCWPGQDALGKRFKRDDGTWFEVVGVTTTGKYMMVAEPPRPCAYFALEQNYIAPLTALIRSDADPESVATAVRSVVRDLDPDLPIYNVRRLDEFLQNSVFGFMPFRMGATITGVQGVIALLLGIMGLYAVVSYGVTQRTQEIGVRVALGAGKRQILRLVLQDSARITLSSIGIGLLVALGCTFVMSHAVYGVKAVDPWVILGVITVLLSTAALACYIPARRAMAINPVQALRHE